MSIVKVSDKEVDGLKQVEAILLRANVNKKGEISDEVADYNPTEEELDMRALILRHFILGTTTMYTPRVEFNDLSVVMRDQYDQMSFNTYQPNNGEAWEGAPQQAWRSRALKPIVRNKCVSIAAHATARLLFPKVFAFNEASEPQHDAAKVLEDLMEWSGDISNYPYYALGRVIQAMSSPASIGYTEYGEVTRQVKKERGEDGKWIMERVRDEAYPLFMDTIVPVDQLYIQNIFEPEIQKQGWLIWRKVYAFSEAQNKYNGVYENFKYVRPGVQTIYDDANRTFYYVYDPNMRSENVEEIMYWNKNLDVKIIMVNGVMLTEYDNPNPRQDKLYPFDKFGYEIINSKFFYYKSLAFKLQHDAEIVNTLYQMVIDGTYLSIFKPMINRGGEIIASDVIVPGAVTTFSDPNAQLEAINVGADLRSGLETLAVVEKSVSESSQEPMQQGIAQSGSQTAYEISRLESNANTVLGLFIQMISKHVRDFGNLRKNDILQYLTAPEISTITGNDALTYKTFFIKGAEGENGKKIEFKSDLPDTMSYDEYLNASYRLLGEEKKKKMTISYVNPTAFRELKYMVTISPDTLTPRSEQLERAYALEDFDRMIAHPELFDSERVSTMLLANNPITRNDIEGFKVKVNPAQQAQMMAQGGQMPAAGNSPLAAVMGKNPLANQEAPKIGSPEANMV